MRILEWIVISILPYSLNLKQNIHLDDKLALIPWILGALTICLCCIEEVLNSKPNLQTLMLKNWKLRKHANHGLWCSLLLPTALASQIEFSSESYQQDVVVLAVILTSCFAFLLIFKLLFQRSFEVEACFVSILASFVMYAMDILDIPSCLVGLVAIPSFLYFLDKFLRKYEFTFSIGEAIIVSQGITIFFAKFILSLLSKYSSLNTIGEKDIDVVKALVQIGGIGCMLIVFILHSMHEKYFYEIFLTVSCAFIFPVVIYQYPLLFAWIFKFIFMSPVNMLLVVSWLILVICAILFANYSKNFANKTRMRKFFHVIVVLVFTPGIIFSPSLTFLASSGALYLFMLLECVRFSKAPVFSEIIQTSFNKFLDEKDEGFLVLTHIYLLVGCSLPVWILPHFEQSKVLPALSGVISLGIGDAFASVFGSLYGKHHWPGSKKTVEGTFCAIISMLGFIFLLNHPLGLHIIIDKSLIWLIGCVLLTGILEAVTDQVDNLVLPLYLFAMLSF